MDRDKEKEEMVKKEKAVLEHRFSNHTYCDSKWCNHLHAKNEGKKVIKGKRYYTNWKNGDKCKTLKEFLAPFMKEDVLLESVHSMSTQKNESMNHSIYHLCPKSKHLGNTSTLLTRVRVLKSL